MHDVTVFARQVLANCTRSDATHAGLYSVCGLALRLRDLYKWENRLPPWEERDAALVLDWIGEKEARWEELAGSAYRDLTIFGHRFDPFDTVNINAVLEPLGFYYGAGYAHSLKPSFFLARICSKGSINGITIYTLGEELARDLLTLPALSQDHHIVLREVATRLYLWDQMAYIKKSGRLALRFALANCGIKGDDRDSLRRGFETIFEAQREGFIYHELGELHNTGFERSAWQKIVAAFPHSPVELLARTVKDLLADTCESGPLPYFIQERKTAALGFYVAFQEGLAAKIFSELRPEFETFTRTRNWSKLKRIVQEAYRRFVNMAGEMVRMFETACQEDDPDRAKQEITSAFL